MLAKPIKNNKVHFVGIGGAALNGIAQVLASRGYQVQGSDLVKSVVTERLEQQGIKVFIGHKAANITADIDEVIISSAAVLGPGAVEIAAAKQLHLPVNKRTVWWSRLTGQAKQAVAVAGTHGKTSTTAMIGYILQTAGLNPTVLVGGLVPDFNNTVRVGSPDLIVIEADEYDKAFYSLRPTISVITSLDYDHPDTYPTEQAYRRAFGRFARLVHKRHGLIVACGDDAAIRQQLKNFTTPIYWYSAHRAYPNLKLNTPGDHMLANAMAAAKVAHQLQVKHSVIIKALNKFAGVSRRFEYLGQYQQLKVYDDYAHHPQEIKVNLELAKRLSRGKVAVLFQPHQRIRTQRFLKEFAQALSLADRVGVLPLFVVAGRESDIKVSSEDIVLQVKHSSFIQPDEIQTFADQLSKEYDILIIMGAGNVSDLARQAFKFK